MKNFANITNIFLAGLHLSSLHTFVQVKKCYLLSVFAILLAGHGRGQVNVRDSVVGAPLVSLSYCFQIPAADLKERFGNNSNTGLHFIHKTRSQWVWGAEWAFLFSSAVKEKGILDSIRTTEGFVIDQNGEYGVLKMYERGWTAGMRLGRLLPLFGPNKNSGILLMAGSGYLQHKIRIEDVAKRVPQLSSEYLKGYDRLTSGHYVSAFVGYLHLGNQRLANFFIGYEFTQAFTKSRRSFNFDTMMQDTRKRIDILSGPRFGVILPLYKRVPDDFYFH